MEYAYVGSYTTEKRGGLGYGGISVFCRQSSDFPWREIQVFERKNPSFLAFGKDQSTLYAVQSDGEWVAAFSIDPVNGTLRFLNERKIGFHNGVFLQTDRDSNFLVVCSCSGQCDGGIVSFRLEKDGSLGDIANIEIPAGTLGPLRLPQNAVKPHQAKFTPDYRYLVEVDKGLDAVNTYRMNDDGGLCLVSTTACRPGSCPRHIAFSQDGQYAYILTEWFGTVVSCRFQDGVLSPMEILPTIPSTFLGMKNSAAEIEIHPNGKLLYVSNREQNSIAAFRIKSDGTLQVIDWFDDHVSKPRFFAISEDGSELYVANEKAHNVSRYQVDTKTGCLTYLDADMSASAPACILFRNT